MNTLAKAVSLVALAATIVPSILYFSGTIDHEAVKWTALVGTAVWFVATPLWVGRKLPVDSADVEI